jgi:hypothetical protein
VTCPFLHAVLVPKIGEVRHSANEQTFVRRYNGGPRERGRLRLANWRYKAHFDGEHTYYFVGAPWTSAPLSLAMIDIDIQKARKVGTPEGARQFAELLKGTWPGLAFEPSTGGKGRHGYFLVAKAGRTAADVRAALKALEHRLSQLLADSGLDVEMVEVKGAPPEIAYDRAGKAFAVHYGTAAKLPRTLTAEQLQAAPRFTVEELLALDVPRPKVPRRSRGLNAGSVSGVLFPDAELANLSHYAELARALTGGASLRTSGRPVATIEDFAVVLLLLNFLDKNRNADGAMPTERVRSLWEALYQAGNVGRQWSYKRFAAIRNFLSDSGLIAWQDNQYAIGRACKWAPAPELIRLVTVKDALSSPPLSQSSPGPRPVVAAAVEGRGAA